MWVHRPAPSGGPNPPVSGRTRRSRPRNRGATAGARLKCIQSNPRPYHVSPPHSPRPTRRGTDRRDPVVPERGGERRRGVADRRRRRLRGRRLTPSRPAGRGFHPVSVLHGQTSVSSIDGILEAYPGSRSHCHPSPFRFRRCFCRPSAIALTPRRPRSRRVRAERVPPAGQCISPRDRCRCHRGYHSE